MRQADITEDQPVELADDLPELVADYAEDVYEERPDFWEVEPLVHLPSPIRIMFGYRMMNSTIDRVFMELIQPLEDGVCTHVVHYMDDVLIVPVDGDVLHALEERPLNSVIVLL